MFLVADVLRREECAKLITTLGGQAVAVKQPDYSDYWRHDFKDAFLRNTLQERVAGACSVPITLSLKLSYTMYKEGGYIKEHTDGKGRVGASESTHTVLFYLNDDYEGGELCCKSLNLCLRPAVGSMIVMRQDIYHSVSELTYGTKSIIRVDGRWPSMERFVSPPPCQ